jgi:hypothetical protein
MSASAVGGSAGSRSANRCARRSRTCSRPGCQSPGGRGRPVLPPAGNPDDHQAPVTGAQDVGAESHRLEGAGAKILDQLLKAVFSGSQSEVIIAGFGNEEVFPSLSHTVSMEL